MTYLRFAFRSLLKTPLVTGVALLSLALGTGANAAIFSIFERMILRSLPVEEPDRLVNLLSPGPKSGSVSTTTPGGIDHIFSYPMLRDLEEVQEVFTGIAGHFPAGANLAYGGNTMSAEALMVSGSYFEVLGLKPAEGRLFTPDDDRTPGAHPVVVLSYTYWKNHFDQDPSVVGESLVVNGRPMTIVGVAPRAFSGTTLGQNPKIFVPLSMRGVMTPGWDAFDNRRAYWIYLFARLRPDVSLEQAAVTISGPYRGILQEVELPLQGGMSEKTREQFAAKKIDLEPGYRGQSVLHTEARTPLLMLLGVTGVVLLIACANLANLLLVKAINRGNEIAVRLSIGARRGQVMAQLMTESFVLAAAGSVAGYLVAHGMLRLILALLPSAGGEVDFTLGPVVWLFLAALSIVTGLVGLVPAATGTRHDLATTLKNQGGHSSGSRGAHRFRAAMATLQIALSMALLVSAGLFTKSLLNVSRVDLGIDEEQIAMFGLSPELNGYSPEESRNFFARVEEEIEALPGVVGVAASQVPLMSGSNWMSNVSVEGFPSGPDTDTTSSYNEVGPGYFRTLGIPLVSGREFETGDTEGAPKVAVVNEAFAHKFDLGTSAVGKRMQIGAGDKLDIEIVGLVENAKYSNVKDPVPPVFFLPYRQNEEIGAVNFYVRSALDPADVLPTLRSAVARLDANLPIENLQTMKAQVRENVLVDRILSTLSAAFAILATVLAAIGLYGVIAFSVARRTREFGLRIALGADGTRVRKLVLAQVGTLTLAGAAVGVLGALGLGRLAGSLLYGLEGHDPGVYAVSVVLLVAVAALAGLFPAERAARIDPMTALREE